MQQKEESKYNFDFKKHGFSESSLKDYGIDKDVFCSLDNKTKLEVLQQAIKTTR